MSETADMDFAMSWKRHVRTGLSSLLHKEDGQDIVEYALLLAFVALAVVAILSGIKVQLKGLFSTVNSTLASVNTSAS